MGQGDEREGGRNEGVRVMGQGCRMEAIRLQNVGGGEAREGGGLGDMIGRRDEAGGH